jgi:prophage regulatory protein
MSHSQAEVRRAVVEHFVATMDRHNTKSRRMGFFRVRIAHCSIENQANLIQGDNVGCSNDTGCSEATATSSSDDSGGGGNDSGDGDSDPEPDRITQIPKPKTRKAKPPRNDLPSEGYVRLPQVLAVIPISKSSWWAGCKSGRYPPPIKLSHRTTVWRVSDIRALIEERWAA